MSFFSSLVKKRISEQRLASIFVSGLVKTVELGFADVANLINDDPDFAISPKVSSSDDNQFLLITLTGNIKLMSDRFEGEQELRVRRAILEQCATLFETDYDTFGTVMREYSDLMMRLNYPSKNILYAMSKAVFVKYNLTDFQTDYFRTLKTPNPLILKRMNEIMANFIWDWDAFLEKHKVQ
jgi:hypothetical protein